LNRADFFGVIASPCLLLQAPAAFPDSRKRAQGVNVRSASSFQSQHGD